MYFKIEMLGVVNKLCELIWFGGDVIEGLWDGEEVIMLFVDFYVGVIGVMMGGGFLDGIWLIFEVFCEGWYDDVFVYY